MPAFHESEGNWRHCAKCQSLYLHVNPQGDCPGEGKHAPGAGNLSNYHGMANSPWIMSKEVAHLHQFPLLVLKGNLEGKLRQAAITKKARICSEYSLVVNSTYNEHDQDWRWCKNCQTLFLGGVSSGKCAAGGAHDSSQWRLGRGFAKT